MMLDFCESLYMYVWLIEIMKGTLRRYYISIHFAYSASYKTDRDVIVNFD